MIDCIAVNQRTLGIIEIPNLKGEQSIGKKSGKC